MKVSWVVGAVILSCLKVKSLEPGTYVLEMLRGWIQDAGTA